MGSWNNHCLLSRFTITHGEIVKCIILIQSNGRDNICPARYWKPVGLPITGEYNDYGSVENIKDDFNAKFTFDLLKEKLMESTSVDVNSQCHRFTPPTNMEEMIEQIERGYADYKGLGGKPQNISITMIHNDIWKMAVNLAGDSTTWTGKTMLQIIEENRAKSFNEMKEQFADYLPNSEMMEHIDFSNPVEELIKQLNDLIESMPTSTEVSTFKTAVTFMLKTVGRRRHFFNEYSNWEYIQKEMPWKIEKECALVTYFMERMNLAWQPPATSTQDDESEFIRDAYEQFIDWSHDRDEKLYNNEEER